MRRIQFIMICAGVILFSNQRITADVIVRTHADGQELTLELANSLIACRIVINDSILVQETSILKSVDSSENKYIEVDAKVVWIADKEIQPLESPAMGLEFYKISGESQEAIIDFVDKNLASEEFEKNGL